MPGMRIMLHLRISGSPGFSWQQSLLTQRHPEKNQLDLAVRGVGQWWRQSPRSWPWQQQSKISGRRRISDEKNSNFIGGRGIKWLGSQTSQCCLCAGLPRVACRCISHDLQTVNPPKQWRITTEYMIQVEILRNSGLEDCPPLPSQCS